MRRLIILAVLVTVLHSFGQALAQQPGQSRRTIRLSPTPLDLYLQSKGIKDSRFGDKSTLTSKRFTGIDLKPPAGASEKRYLLTNPLNKELAKLREQYQSPIWKSQLSTAKPLPTPLGLALDIKEPRFGYNSKIRAEWWAGVDPKVVAGAGGGGYLLTNLSEAELTKRLRNFAIHSKRIPGIIKLIKKPAAKGALFAVAVTGTTAYVYQQYTDGQQVSDKSDQISVPQQTSKEEVKPPPGTTIHSPTQENQTRGSNKYTIGGIAGVGAFFVFLMLYKKQWVE